MSAFDTLQTFYMKAIKPRNGVLYSRGHCLILPVRYEAPLIYDVETDAPVEVLWTFPAQDGLSMPVTLGIQNGDELNFGVTDFWSYFFPFDQVAADFEGYLDAWVDGNARIATTGRSSRLLQVREGDDWKTVYGAGGCLFPFRKRPRGFLRNEAQSP